VAFEREVCLVLNLENGALPTSDVSMRFESNGLRTKGLGGNDNVTASTPALR
jgi:hypothetical protein